MYEKSFKWLVLGGLVLIKHFLVYQKRLNSGELKSGARQFSILTKVRLFNNLVMSVLLYDSET